MIITDKFQNQTKFIAQEISKRSQDFVKSPFRYPGGKFYAWKYILPFINCVIHDEYREPFVGGGSILFAKSKSRFNWLNDLEIDLIKTYQVIADKNQRSQFGLQLAQEIATPQRHKEIKKIIPSTLFEVAFKTFYLNRTSYSGIINKPALGYKEGKSSPPENGINFIEHSGKKLENVQFSHTDFQEVITAKPRGNVVMMYLDPPYFKADQKRAYTKAFSEEDHKRLARCLKQSDYLFCLSYDNCDEIRDLYDWANIYEREWLYNTANKKGEKREKGNELIITNYQVSFSSQPSLLE